MSVDLPAPFSPTKALTSPDRISKSTSFRAITPGNDLDMPRATSTGSIDEPVVPTVFEGICDSSFIRFVLGLGNGTALSQRSSQGESLGDGALDQSGRDAVSDPLNPDAAKLG